MSVDATTVRRIAHLARIAVTDAEVPHLQGELNAMLAFVEQLSEVNVEGVEHGIDRLVGIGRLALPLHGVEVIHVGLISLLIVAEQTHGSSRLSDAFS